jgi:hypothetical protein
MPTMSNDRGQSLNVKRRILDRVDARGAGAVWTPIDFLDLGPRAAVDKASPAVDGPARAVCTRLVRVTPFPRWRARDEESRLPQKGAKAKGAISAPKEGGHLRAPA